MLDDCCEVLCVLGEATHRCNLLCVSIQEDYDIKSFLRPSEKTSGIHVEPKFSGVLVPYKSQGRDSGGFFVDKCEMLELS